MSKSSRLAKASSSQKKEKKPSGSASRPLRHRTVSRSETDLPDHVKKLAATLQTFPVFDLLSRQDFSELETEEKQKISGRALKKVVQLQKDKNPYLLKKNAREAEREKDGKKTPSSEMDIDKNHTETFREICALRLFQLIWQEPDKPVATAPDAKVVLSSFKSKKPDNIIKKQWTKAYFASQQVDNLEFNTMRLSVDNLKKLEEINEDGTLKNQHLIDQLCEQIIIQCILSNPDAIKFDNFFVDDKKGVVVQFDFGDARNDEEYSPDPLCILDTIRKHLDGSSTKSIKKFFTEENFVYAQAIKFFNKHITPVHLLNVIEKLSRIHEKVLWQTSYNYSYGYEQEKRNYADCFVARVRNFMALKNVLEKFLEDEVSNENFSSKPIKTIVAESAEFRESKKDSEICIETKEVLDKASEIYTLLLIEREKLDETIDQEQQESSEEEDEDRPRPKISKPEFSSFEKENQRQS